MPSARAFPPRNPMDRASAEVTRPFRRRPDIAWRNSLSSKVFVVGRYEFSGGRRSNAPGGKPYVGFRGTGRGGPSGEATTRGFRDGGRSRHRIPSSERTNRRVPPAHHHEPPRDRKSTPLNSSHVRISYADFCLKKKNTNVVRNVQCNRSTGLSPT